MFAKLKRLSCFSSIIQLQVVQLSVGTQGNNETILKNRAKLHNSTDLEAPTKYRGMQKNKYGRKIACQCHLEYTLYHLKRFIVVEKCKLSVKRKFLFAHNKYGIIL